MKRRPTGTTWRALLGLAPLLFASTVWAVEVRQGATRAHWEASLGRAWVPCVAPNTTAFNGLPACSPAVSSVCGFVDARLTIDANDDLAPTGRFELRKSNPPPRPPECETGTYVLEIVVRVSAEDGDADDAELPCGEGRCTLEDDVLHIELSGASTSFVLPLRTVELIGGNVEILRVTLIAPDGLPMAGMAAGPSNVDNLVMMSNLTVPHAACTNPAPQSGGWCPVAPWTSPCDYESGEITIRRDPMTGAGDLHATFRDATGTSPLCMSGTHTVAATVRATVPGCGDPAHPDLCTIVDQSIAIPMLTGKKELTAPLHVGFAGKYGALEVFGARIVDPTGADLAAPGVPSARNVNPLRVTSAGDKLRVKMTIPVDSADEVVDPTLADGLTLTVSDRNGSFYTVTIPAERWQLQPPIGSRWDYNDAGGVLSGARKIRLKRLGNGVGTTGYQLDLSASGIDLSGADFPGATVAVTIARPAPFGPLHAQGNRTCKLGPTKLTCK